MKACINEKHTLSLEGKPNNIKMSVLPKVKHSFNASPIKIWGRTLQGFGQDDSKFICESSK